jgi:hypothetical protein
MPGRDAYLDGLLGHDRPERAQDAKPRAPITKENKRAENRFGRPEEVARAPNTEGLGLWLINGTSISTVYWLNFWMLKAKNVKTIAARIKWRSRSLRNGMVLET